MKTDKHSIKPIASIITFIVLAYITSTISAVGADIDTSIKATADYINNLRLYDIQAQYYNNPVFGRIPGVRFKIKNTGNKTVDEIEVTVYFKDKSGKVITEKQYTPVVPPNYNLLGIENSTPLKPGYIYQTPGNMFLPAQNVPSEWKEGSVVVNITNIEFSESKKRSEDERDVTARIKSGTANGSREEIGQEGRPKKQTLQKAEFAQKQDDKAQRMREAYQVLEKERSVLRDQLSNLRSQHSDQKLTTEQAEEYNKKLMNAYILVNNPPMLSAYKNLKEIHDEIHKVRATEKALQKQLTAEQKQHDSEQARRDMSFINQYGERIKRAIRKEFNPIGLPEGLSCVFIIRMIPGGQVVDEHIVKSSGNDIFDRRAETALSKASPLPVPDDPRLFEKMREIRLTFRPVR